MSEKSLIKGSRVDNSVLIVELCGSLDASHQKTLKDELDRFLLRESDIVLDFSGVSFIDSSCLGLLVAKAREAREKKGDIRISGLIDDVLSIFQITRLDRVFTLFDGVDEAVSSYYK